MAAAGPKQFLPVLGKPLIWHTLAAFERCRAIDKIVLVLPPEMVQAGVDQFQTGGEFSKIACVVPGGKTRQESVGNGLRFVPAECRIVVVHDGVRPVVGEDIIVKTIEAAQEWGSAIAAIPVADTLKNVSDDGRISGTLERRHIWCAQTPQAFRLELLQRAYHESRTEALEATDEAALVERLGEPVYVVRGSSTNIKVTTPSDLKMVELLLREKYGSVGT